VPLPETADEPCAVAEDVKALACRDILMDAKATEDQAAQRSRRPLWGRTSCI